MHSLSLYNSKKNYIEGNPVPLPILTIKNNPVIRKAKNIRTDAQNQNVLLDIPKQVLPTKPLYGSLKTESNNYAQPPPYHIAAARSQYFNSLDCNECVNLSTQKTQDDKLIPSVNYSKYSLIKKDYVDDSNYSYEQVPLTSDEQNSCLDSVYYDDVKMVHDQNNFCNNIQNDNKPRTFIQDKPTPNEYIVAPTPKRPVSSDSTSLQFYKDANNGNIQNVNSNPTHLMNNQHNKDNVTPYWNNIENNQKSLSDDSPTTPSNSSLKWAFGQHRNATVSQVTIQKSTELGFTVSQKYGHVKNIHM